MSSGGTFSSLFGNSVDHRFQKDDFMTIAQILLLTLYIFIPETAIIEGVLKLLSCE